MTRPARTLGAIAVALAAAIALPSPAHAHDDEVALFVEPQTASPGGSIVLRADLPTTSPVSLELVGGRGPWLISPWLWAGVAVALGGIAGAVRTARRVRTQPAGASSPPT